MTHKPWIDGKGIDREVVAKLSPCEKCGQPYHYESEETEDSYRAFAVCACDRIEF